MMEEMVSNELGAGITEMTRMTLDTRKLIEPIINTDFSLQEVKGDVN